MSSDVAVGRYSVEVCREPGAGWRSLEARLLDAGVPLALPHRSEWVESRQQRAWLVAVRTEAGYRTAFALHAVASRALPGHRLLRAERVGHDGDAAATAAGIAAVAQAVSQDARTLRVYLEFFSPDAAVRTQLADAARALGFRRPQHPRGYARTLLVDLSPGEDELFAALPKKTRRDIRLAARHPVALRTVEDPSFAARMDTLLRETMSRTGGRYEAEDWEPILALGSRHPELSRVAGLFRTDKDGPDSLLAYAWGRHHSGHVQYATAASTRQTDLKLPLAYPIVWDLLCWAKRHGAGYFDFGGVSGGTHGSGDPVGGISDFKRYFSTNVAEVGDEWILEPHRIRAATARALGSVSRLLRGRGG